MTDAAATAAPAAMPAIREVTSGYRRYALFLLLTIYIFNFIDRQVINILAEPIKNDLGLADWQLGLMSGFAFAIFYTVLGLPIARLAERNSRPLIISTALAAWSGFTALCGLAQNFTQLVLARIGVGVGEAGCTPAHSLITDYVPKEKRASALAFYAMGTPIGGLIGTALGGVIADAYGWRTAFFVCGLPGIVLAVIAVATLIEPRAKAVVAAVKEKAQAGATFGETLGVLLAKRTFWFIAFAAAIKAFIGYGHAPFTASFFLRNHSEQIASMATDTSLALTNAFAAVGLGWEIKLQALGFLALALALMSGVGGAFGAFLGGQIADRYGAKDLRAYVSVPGVASLITIPFYIFAVTTDIAILGICTLAINGVLGTLWYGPVYATAQSIVPPHMRATSSAILLFVINLIGLGAGPLFVGLLSDMLAGPMGLGSAEGVRWALILSALVGVLAFVCFWIARRTIRHEMEG
jgi:MFS family permease